MAKVLITGGAGFIGSHVVDQFLAAGDTVAVVDNLSTGSRTNLSGEADFFEADIRSAATVKFIADFRPDIVVHAAAQMSVSASMKDPRFDTEVNVLGLVNILQGIREHLSSAPPRFIFFSTGGAIYGEQDEFPADESHAIRPTSIYGLAKRVGEQYLDLWNREFGLPFTALRLSNVYGPRQNPHGEAGVVAIFAEKLLSGQTPTINGTGEFTRDYIYVSDVVKAVELAARSDKTGIYNVGTGVETTVNEIFESVRMHAGSEVSAQYGPQRAGDQERSCISAQLISHDLGWSADYDLKSGMKKTVAWFKERAEGNAG